MKVINKFHIHKRRKFEYTKAEKKTASLKELKSFFKYYGKFKGILLGLGIIFLIHSALSILGPIFTGEMIAMFTEDLIAREIIKYALIILIINLVNTVLGFFINRFWVLISTNSTYLITKDLTKRLNYISQRSFDEAGSGTFTTRMYGDISVVGSVPLEIMGFFSDALTQFGFVAYTFSLNIWVGLFMLVYAVSSIIVEFIRINVRQRNRKIIRNVAERESSFRQENLRGMKDIRGVNATDSVIEKSLSITTEKLEYEYSSSLIMNWLSRLKLSVNNILNFAFIALCVYLLVNGQMELAAFMIAYNYRGRINSFASYVINIKSYVSDCAFSAQRLNEIFDENKYPTEKFGDVELKETQGLIEFKNVTFGYNTESTVLKDISFDVKPNSITSLVGLSGAGKSTIVSLIDRLYDLDENNGEITLDGINIKDLNRESLRSNICSITQSPYIYNMTVAENLRLAKNDATDEEIIESLKKANVYDYIEQLPEKLDSKLGENGIKLSGGQKQRLAIARAILRDSKVILFDEATSALDNNNQAIIKKTIKELSKTHTIIMIAHRLSTVVDSDNIIFIKEGSVFAQGTHNELMENCEDYHNLYIEEDVE